MIDEKKLIIEIEKRNVVFTEEQLDLIESLIESQPQLDNINCSECSRRKFYQEGYQDGLNADKWIPCSERLPESDKNVLLAVDADGNKVVTIGMLVYDVWLMEDEYYSYTSANWEVQAWQPLPEPYKGE